MLLPEPNPLDGLGHRRVRDPPLRGDAPALPGGLPVHLRQEFRIECPVFLLDELFQKDGIRRPRSRQIALLRFHEALEAPRAVPPTGGVGDSRVVDVAEDLVDVVLDLGLLLALEPQREPVVVDEGLGRADLPDGHLLVEVDHPVLANEFGLAGEADLDDAPKGGAPALGRGRRGGF